MSTTNTASAFCCAFCGGKGKLFRCSRCKVVHYCNQQDQAAHRPAHKSACNAIARQRDIVQGEEEKLRSHPGDMFVPPNPFETAVGRFWGITETRGYMRARFALVESLQRVKTVESTQAQLDHLMDMLRLCRGDNMGVRSLVPALMLRLDKDQECYDFVKWYNTTGEESDYDWGNMDLPYLDVRDADVFEGVRYLCSKYGDLSMMVGVTLLKIKLLLDFKALQNSAVIGQKVPREILDRIRAYIPRSPIIAGDKGIIEHEDHTSIINKLTVQIHALYKAVEANNEHFWPSLLQPGRHLTARPQTYSPGSIEHMQLVLQYSYDSWVEVPGAIKVIEAKIKGHVSK